MTLLHMDLFSGIGGFALAARWAGWETIGFSEIDPYCCKVLAKNFPGVPNYGDITQLDGRAITADLITGGPPCQPASFAGKRQGTADDRWLWPEALRVMREVSPTWVVFENVYGFITLNGGVEFEHLLTSLENEGYEVQPLVIPACAVNAPHRRDRVWIIAHLTQPRKRELSIQSRRSQYPRVDTHGGTEATSQCCCRRESQSRILRDFHGVSERLDGNKGRVAFSDVAPLSTKRVPHQTARIRALGNAVVPALAAVILKAIREVNIENHDS